MPVLQALVRVADVVISFADCLSNAHPFVIAMQKACAIVLPKGCTYAVGNEPAVTFDPGIVGTLAEAVLDSLRGKESPEAHPVPQSQPGTAKAGTQELRASTREFVLYNDWGIGDELLLSAVAREIVRTHKDTRVWIRSRHGFRFPAYVRSDPPTDTARRIEVIYQNATLCAPRCHSPYPGHLVQQMLDKFYVDTQLLVQAEDVRPELEGGRDDPSTGGSRSVVVHSKPNPRLPTKDWGLDRWKGLSELLHEQKIAIRQVGAKEEPLLPFAEDLRGTPPAELPPIVAGSAAVICLVGFLMHLAEAVGTPTIVIYGGREHPAIDGYPDQIHLASSPLACRGRWGCHLGPDITCPHDMKCMNGLTPELVASTLLTILEPQNEGRRP